MTQNKLNVKFYFNRILIYKIHILILVVVHFLIHVLSMYVEPSIIIQFLYFIYALMFFFFNCYPNSTIGLVHIGTRGKKSIREKEKG